ncbi:hypothetical protein Patl1_29363 [Pistacia atlantica]|uniref:Uncharacterized protein n=1 Tax=Pistacia atlantica TaxID=434234 RepID=A0ACC1ABY4_9ROSI|nr:hypothetical protein Patl1_29363 [Pistacia atlantica]
MTVPQFGGWDHKQTDYSMVFQRARANRKQQKADIRRSFGNEQEILAAQQQEDPVIVRLSYTLHIPLCFLFLNLLTCTYTVL